VILTLLVGVLITAFLDFVLLSIQEDMSNPFTTHFSLM